MYKATSLSCGKRLTKLSIGVVKYRLFRTFSFCHSYKSHFVKPKYFLLPHTFHFKRHLMDLASVIKIFEEKVPSYLSESWDNTGLLIDTNKTEISTILFTNDLTEAVLEEAVARRSNLIISYHPPIFTPIKSLKNSKWKDRIVIKCIENGIAVYSPHTSCDAVVDGVNDWLLNCFDISNKHPIHPSFESQPKYSHMVDFNVFCGKEVSQLVQTLPESELCSTSVISDKQYFRVKVNKSSLNTVLELLTTSGDVASVSVTSLNPLPVLSCGMGRIGTLAEPLPLRECIETVKAYLKLNYIRFAQSTSHSLGSPISTVAVCAGSGSSVLKDIGADLYITGEMSHHDLLDANHKNVSVILCEHSNSERGYLKHLVESLKPKLSGIKLIISATDIDPIRII